MSIEENKAVVRRVFEEGWNKRDLETIFSANGPNLRRSYFPGPCGIVF